MVSCVVHCSSGLDQRGVCELRTHRRLSGQRLPVLPRRTQHPGRHRLMPLEGRGRRRTTGQVRRLQLSPHETGRKRRHRDQWRPLQT